MRLDRWTQRFVTHNVAVSQGVADFAVREIGLAAAKVSVIQNGVDLARFADAVPADLGRFGIPSGARVILFVGRLHPQKAPDVLLRGALPVLTAQPDVHLLFVGDGPLRAALEREASGTLAASRIHFAGRQEDVPGLLRAATVCVLPSRWEGMPNVVLEAMAAGCPVLATDVEGTREVVRPGETGWLLPCDSVPALQAGLVDSLGNASLRSSLARAAQGLVSKEFTWGSVANQYADLYGRLLQRSPRC
jgi:starch synthase (maltosyl-transferring)